MTCQTKDPRGCGRVRCQLGRRCVELEPFRMREHGPLRCRHCGGAFKPFLRGKVSSWWRRLLGLPSLALICDACHEIVGWERA